MSDILKADPAARRRALVMIGAVVIATIALLVGYRAYGAALVDWIESVPEERAFRTRLAFMAPAFVFSGPLLFAARRLWSIGTRTIESKQFPPAGLPLIRDTSVMRDTDAVTRGRRLRMLAIALATGISIVCILLWRIASEVIATLS